jgi:hypothetical protein
MDFYGLGRSSEDAWTCFVEKLLQNRLGNDHPHRSSTGLIDDMPPAESLTSDSDKARKQGSVDEHTWDTYEDDPTSEWIPPDIDSLISLSPTPPRKFSPVLYRVCPPTVQAVQSFGAVALEAGGVILSGAMITPSGAPAVVAVVHPKTLTEFHVPGEVQPSPQEKNGVTVKFIGVTERTKQAFDRFALGGNPPTETTAGVLGPSVDEMVIFESQEEAQWDLVIDRQRAVLVEKLLPFQSALDPFGKLR